MAKATRKHKPRIVKKQPSDAPLIRACVLYAQSISAYHAGFLADPDGNSNHAEPMGERPRTAAIMTLAKLATMKAETAAGLSAMARIVPLIAKDGEGRFGDLDAANFILAFADNVKEWMRPIVAERMVMWPATDQQQPTQP